MNEIAERDFRSQVSDNPGPRHSAVWGRNARNFFAELKRRHVYRVSIAYSVVAWLVIQIAAQVFPFFEISNWIVRLVVLATLLGFPIAVIVAWAFEMTPEGLKRDNEVAPGEHTPRRSTRRFAALIISVAILGAGVPLFQLIRSNPGTVSEITVSAVPSQSPLRFCRC